MLRRFRWFALPRGVDSSLLVSITITGDAVCKATDKTYRLDTASASNFLDDLMQYGVVIP